MLEEMMQIGKTMTWSLMTPPKDYQSIGLVWFFKLNKNPSGDTIKDKARFMVKGCVQNFGVDFTDVFSM